MPFIIRIAFFFTRCHCSISVLLLLKTTRTGNLNNFECVCCGWWLSKEPITNHNILSRRCGTKINDVWEAGGGMGSTDSAFRLFLLFIARRHAKRKLWSGNKDRENRKTIKQRMKMEFQRIGQFILGFSLHVDGITRPNTKGEDENPNIKKLSLQKLAHN